MLLPQLLRHLGSGAWLSVDLSSLAIPPMALFVLFAAPVVILCEKLYLSCSPPTLHDKWVSNFIITLVLAFLTTLISTSGHSYSIRSETATLVWTNHR